MNFKFASTFFVLALVAGLLPIDAAPVRPSHHDPGDHLTGRDELMGRMNVAWRE